MHLLFFEQETKELQKGTNEGTRLQWTAAQEQGTSASHGRSAAYARGQCGETSERGNMRRLEVRPESRALARVL